MLQNRRLQKWNQTGLVDVDQVCSSRTSERLHSFFLSPVRVISILKGHGVPFVLHMLSQYSTNAAFAANHWLQFRAATHQFRSPKYVHENEASARSHLLGGRPLLLDGADGKLCAQSSKGIQATAVAAQEN